MSPIISVIVPVYNTAVYLKQCVDSVLAQDFHDWELLLIDDGSADGSAEICKSYAERDNRIKVISQENAGPSVARNNGIGVARGGYLFFLDSDDVLSCDALSHLYRVVKECGVDIAVGRHVFADNYDFIRTSGRYRLKVYNAEKMISNVLYQKQDFDSSVCWKLYKAELFKGLKFSRRYEDLDIFYRLYERAGNIAVSDQIIYFYRKHPDSFINSWSDGRLDVLSVADNIVSYVAGRYSLLKRAALHRQFSAYFNIYIGLNLNEPGRSVEADGCFSMIKKLRTGVLFDRHSRLKNRIGALASYLGNNFLIRLAKWASKY